MTQGIISYKDHAKLINDALKDGWIDDLLQMQEQEKVSLHPYDNHSVESFLNATLLLSIRKGNLDLFNKVIQKQNTNPTLNDYLPLRLAAEQGQLQMVNGLLQNPQVLTYVKANLSSFIENPKIKTALNSQLPDHIAFRTEFDRLTGRNLSVNSDAILDAALQDLIKPIQQFSQTPQVKEAYDSIASSEDPTDKMFLGLFNSIFAQANQGLRELAPAATTQTFPVFSFPSAQQTTPQPAAQAMPSKAPAPNKPAAPTSKPAAPTSKPTAPTSKSAAPTPDAFTLMFNELCNGLLLQTPPSKVVPKATPKKAAP